MTKLNGAMSQREQVIKFFQTACQDRALQDRLKPPCPPTRQGFAAVAREWGYNFDGTAIDDYVRFYQFYEEFQDAINRAQNGSEPLSHWMQKWQKHLKKFEEDPLRDREDTIKKFM